jgi:hypothetical protein
MIRAQAVVLSLVTAVQFTGCSSGSNTGGEASEVLVEGSIPEPVRQELLRLGAEDQAPRQSLTPEKMQDTLFSQDMLRGDSVRSARLHEVVEEYGWPDSSRVGPEASNAAFLILQHSPDHGFQKRMMPTLEELAKKGSIPPAEAAMLIDRVLMHDNLPQRYGTQFKMIDGRLVLHPVENEAVLEERRASMELPPLDDYMRIMEEFYKAPVVRSP